MSAVVDATCSPTSLSGADKLRAHLGACKDAAEAARTVAAKATAAADLGRSLSASAAETALSFETVPAEVARHHADAIKDGAGRRGFPEALQFRREARVEAIAHAAEAALTCTMLEVEEREAADAAAAAEAALKAATEPVMGIGVDLQLARMKRLERLASEARAVLMAFGNACPIGSGPSPWSVTSEQYNPAHPHLWAIHGEPDVKRATAHWAAYRERLTADPDAVYEPAPREGDYG